DGTLTRVADFTTPIPNDPNGATFSFFDGPTVAGGTVAFIGGDEVSIISIAGYERGRLGTIADTQTLVPDGTGVFLGFYSAIALGPAGVAIQGFGDAGQNGIYSTLAGGGLSRVVAVGDVLDGNTVTDLLLGRDGLSGTSLVFVVLFDNDTSAVYR